MSAPDDVAIGDTFARVVVDSLGKTWGDGGPWEVTGLVAGSGSTWWLWRGNECAIVPGPNLLDPTKYRRVRVS